MPEQSANSWVLEERVFDLLISYHSYSQLSTYPIMQRESVRDGITKNRWLSSQLCPERDQVFELYLRRLPY